MGVDINLSVADACRDVPGLIRAALALLPEGLLLGGAGEGGAFDQEPLVRSAALCLAARGVSLDERGETADFVEYAFVTESEIVVIAASLRDPRLALALACRRETNLAFVVSSARHALARVEACVELGSFDLQ